MKTSLKLILTIAFFIAIFTRIDFGELVDVVCKINLAYLFMAVLCVPMLYATRTFKWKLLLNSVGIERPFGRLYKVLLIGVFYGLMTPGKVGELARIYHINDDFGRSLSTVVVEKLTDMATLVFLSLLVIILFLDSSILLMVAGGVTATFTLVTVLAMNRKAIAFFSNFLGTSIGGYIDALENLKGKPLLKALIVSFIYYLVSFVIAYFVLLALDANVYAVITLPLIILFGNIPITISGLGLRESVAGICFVLLGESATSGVSFSLLLFSIITLIPGIVGWVLTLFEKRSEKF
ncbi:lysylphosphatidylglycerol synthase transmembrane domain-containing protein [Archaeoglobus profundus]|uniref:Lysylphosphatidylglycerol synthetase/UPF0104 n=1 Tax=Archaeoglobus profundus (strain DSM 5631 / JCM 9629 / NBRC 100127 / Av18) TaxID=572546 RepID=D2RDS1_ARCPA|nr:lysylphosphatidylglycerol synthase transmembrane domain-containing protein [Archaeoglobus profundus]ADB58265.1 conserved hypothetical protein [Archaeoglobus profundus DSM 5631]